jgi:hypothetical protein
LKLFDDVELKLDRNPGSKFKCKSLWPKVPPYLPDFDVIHRALVHSIHFFGVSTKLFSPAYFLNPSNSRGLKSRLYISFQKPSFKIGIVDFPFAAASVPLVAVGRVSAEYRILLK